MNLKLTKIISFSLIIPLTFFLSTTFAQSPQKISYQAVVRNSSNQLVTSHAVGIKISILQGSETGTAVYVETQAPITNANGLVTIEIGSGTIVTGTFAIINWAAGTYFIKTETDPSGGTSYTITGTSQLLSVPYALYANTAGNAFSGNYADLTNKPIIADSISNFAVLLTGNQTVTGNKTFTGTISASNQTITNVSDPVTKQDAATKAYVDALKQQIKILEDNLIAAGTYKLPDIDGNQYNVVKINNQVWMKENLKVTHYCNGDSIPNVSDSLVWNILTTGASCDYRNTLANSTIYGKLYNFYTIVDSRNVCPTGWHVPTNDEWTLLTTYLGGESIAGGKLKETGFTHWIAPNTGATNITGYTALPGGFRSSSTTFLGIGEYGAWWSSTAISTSSVWFRGMGNTGSNVGSSIGIKQNGYSVRCLRD
jgi:uncharacterized protein (TIGR02145 family)